MSGNDTERVERIDPAQQLKQLRELRDTLELMIDEMESQGHSTMNTGAMRDKLPDPPIGAPPIEPPGQQENLDQQDAPGGQDEGTDKG